MNWFNHAVLAVTRTSDLAPPYVAPPATDGLPWEWIVLGVVVVVGAALGGWFTTQRRVPTMILSDDVSTELCRVHGLGMPHRSVLETIRKHSGLEHTAELFLSPKIFDAAVAKTCKSKRLGMRQRGLVFEARQCVFG